MGGDFTLGEPDPLIAGRRIIKLGNVTTPQLAVYRPAKEKDTGAAVIICPGGGFSILAYDLEGTEVAAWLNTLGVTGIVLTTPAASHRLLLTASSSSSINHTCYYYYHFYYGIIIYSSSRVKIINNSSISSRVMETTTVTNK